MIDVAEVRDLCADLADNGPGRSGAYELELRCKAARILPAMLDEVERLRTALAEAVDIANDQVRQRTNLAAAVEGDAWRMAALRSALADALDALDAIAAGTFFRPEEYARQKAAALKSKVAP